MLDIFDSLCILLAKAEQKHHYYTKKMLEKRGLGLTPGQMTVLYTLFKGDGLSITQLSRKVYLDNSTLTGLLDRLTRLNLIYREEQPGDRRTYVIYLTDEAKKLEEPIRQTMAAVAEKMLSGISEEELAVFRKVLLNVFEQL